MKRTGNSTPYESYRAVMVARTPDGDDTEVVVTRQDAPGSHTRVWLSVHGTLEATACLDGAAIHELRELLDAADTAGPTGVSTTGRGWAAVARFPR